ncbi:MAG TPA: FAD-dependent oxidoreductase [Solirubrobacteraceae bacterium]|nr:FAD-dependent oxidoreductase [Solirubrobacteraceae bacterium]
MPSVHQSVLIVGGGLAAQRAAETLRARGHHGPLRVVCAEPVAPYDRPPLSKELLASGDGDPSFRPESWYASQGVELLLGRRAAGLDVARRRVRLDDGDELGYDDLIVATGSRPRRLPSLAGRPNVHVLRTLADARALRAALLPGARLAIVGAGFVGQEVAATARRLGVDVTLIEAAPVPLAHVLGERLGTWFASLHREEGVRVELGAAVAETRPPSAVAPGVPSVSAAGLRPVEALVLADGRVIEVDVVVVGVGVTPETRWLAGSPLAGDGVPVDDGARTVVPRVYAAGDVARPVGRGRCEHWEPAARMGAAAARSILGLPAAAAPPESFWSDQYGVRIHLVGEAAGADAIEVDGDLDSRDFTAVLRRRGALVGALLVGRPRELPTWRRRLAAEMEPERIAA